MNKNTNQLLITELLTIKDLYICGRMNLQIGENLNYSKKAAEYKNISDSYTSDSVLELRARREAIDKCDNESLDTVFDTSYLDFDEDLINDLMMEYYGSSKKSVAFASAYNQYADDFNSLIEEQIYHDK